MPIDLDELERFQWGFMAFGAIEVFFLIVWAHYDTLKRSGI